MRIPAATYRLQLESGFTLDDAAERIPYLKQLGISDLYLAPVLEAERGSTHGYDVTDPRCVRAEIGGDAGFARLTAAVRDAGMGVLLDIVPNHMAASTRNPWWRDLLEFGGDSPCSNWFDLSWNSTGDPVRLHLPLLGADLQQALEAGEITLCSGERGLEFRYFEHVLPLTPATYARALQLGAGDPAMGSPVPLQDRAAAIAADLLALEPPATLSQPRSDARRRRALHARDAFLALRRDEPGFRDWVERRLAAIDGSAGIAELLDRQPYRLRSWTTAVREITYRRFFDITTLAGVRVEEPEVFESTHALILGWAAAGDVTGLRVDHIDGLYDPAEYLRHLRRAAPVYIVVEKILAPDENLPPDWQTEGTTGYDFANIVNGWFIEPEGWRALAVEYARATGETASFEEIAYGKRQLVLHRLFGGEVTALLRELRATGVFDLVDDETLDRLLREVTAAMRVYRTYATASHMTDEDRQRLLGALAEARRRAPEIPAAAFDTFRDVLLLEANGLPVARRDAAVRFVTHWQQFTGPVMAKGLEDTALYNYFPLASANDVGGEPGAPHVPTSRLHDFLRARRARSPAALNATSTHDSKRSEDVRTRINVLSELPHEWAALLDTWLGAAKVEGAVDPVMEVLLLQTLLGTWPLRGAPDEPYATRIRDYMLKAAREAKHHTSWREPDPEYEARLAKRVDDVLLSAAGGAARSRVEALARTLSFPGALASLGQTLFKITAPGVPDLYQGTELWCYTLVDPDNRKPVELAKRARQLDLLEPLLSAPDADSVRDLVRGWEDGRIKLFVTSAALRHRRAHRRLFDEGGFLACDVDGARSAHLAAFARNAGREWSVTAVARWLAAAVQPGETLPPGGFWEGTSLDLPPSSPRRWRDVLSGASLEVDASGRLDLADVFRTLPASLLYGEN